MKDWPRAHRGQRAWAGQWSGDLRFHARETTTPDTDTGSLTQKPPFLSLMTECSGDTSCVGGQGLRRDYPEVGGGQQLEQFPLVAVHGGGL